MYYNFSQNNSGGRFVMDHDRGLAQLVIIEAMSYEQAIERAESIGIYFDGCSLGIDCDCCGDRWYRPYREEGSEVAQVYEGRPLYMTDRPPDEYLMLDKRSVGKTAYVHTLRNGFYSANELKPTTDSALD